MSTIAIITVTVIGGAVALAAVAAARDVRVARWTGSDPRHDRDARRAAAKHIRKGQE
ncbi:MAG: hypothetical protein L0I76_26900 [Pseudonocardia sp.]|nr:hypothetical protein [Pseudonocardia sp.]